MVTSKLCTKCLIDKPLEQYWKGTARLGKKAACIPCTQESKRQYRALNKEKLNKYSRDYNKANYSWLKDCHKEYRLNNVEYFKEYYKKRSKTRKKTISLILSNNLRHRLYMSLKKNTKTGSAVRDLGCSIEFLKQYLESKFQSGMSWDNYGLYGWHIDHIIPLCRFDLSKREELLKACHYTNLQPLWAKDNLIKGSKI